MDGFRFDTLTKQFATRQSRRTILRGVAGGVVAALGLGAGGMSARQQKRPLCHVTDDPANPWVVIDVAEPASETHFAHGDSYWCEGHDQDPCHECCSNDDCAEGVCIDGACRSGLSETGGSCDQDSHCLNDTDACCGGTCRNLQTNFLHCGACNNSCDPLALGDQCIEGKCEFSLVR